MRTAMLHSCCCQKASQTISTLPLPPRLMPAIRTMVTIIMTPERQSENARPIFWRRLIRTLQSRMTGRDSTRMSLVMSIAVVIAVSRTVLCCVEVPSHASQPQSNVSLSLSLSSSHGLAHKGEAINREVRASQPRRGYADQTSKYRKGGSKPPPHVQAP